MHGARVACNTHFSTRPRTSIGGAHSVPEGGLVGRDELPALLPDDGALGRGQVQWIAAFVCENRGSASFIFRRIVDLMSFWKS